VVKCLSEFDCHPIGSNLLYTFDEALLGPAGRLEDKTIRVRLAVNFNTAYLRRRPYVRTAPVG